MSQVYEIHVCPLCGAQCSYDGGYEGEGWIFGCEHRAWGSEYGEIEPLTLLVDAGRQVDIAITAAAPAMEKQKRDKVRDDAERAEREAVRRAALTPEQRDREDRTAKIFKDIYRHALEDMIRSNNRLLWSGSETVIPKFRG